MLPARRRFKRRNRTRRWPRVPAVLLGVAVLFGVALYDQMAGGAVPQGSLALPAEKVRAVDGDTLAFGPQRIRLDGIASPEEGHAVYIAARRHLAALLRAAETVECRLKKRKDRYGRAVGGCDGVLPDGTRVDLQRAMVEAGFARACPGWGNYSYLLNENANSLSLPFPRYCWPG